MRFRYLIFGIIIFLLFSVECFCVGYEQSPNLKYNIDSMSVTSGSITFNGWARKTANAAGDDNIGGKNLNIYIAAVKYDNDTNFNKRVGDIKNKIGAFEKDKNGRYKINYYFGGEKKVGDYYFIQEDAYSNEDLLFSTLCYKDSQEKCYEQPSTSTNSPKQKRVSTCYNSIDGVDYSENKESTCETYNNGFSITFDINDLKSAFLGDEEVKVKFLIFITHFTNRLNEDGEKSYTDFSKKSSAYYITDSNAAFDGYGRTFDKIPGANDFSVLVRDLGVYNGVCVGCNKANLYYDFDITTSTSFYLDANYARRINLDNDTIFNPENNDYYNKGYFKSGERFSISGIRNVIPDDAGTGTISDSNHSVVMYKLKTSSSHLNEYYGRGDNEEYWAWSTWGYVDGETILILNRDNDDFPNASCNGKNFSVDCKGKSQSLSCNTLSRVDVTNDLKNRNNAILNNLYFTNAICEVSPKVELNGVYSVIEEIELVPAYTYFSGEPFNYDRDFVINKGRAFGFSLNLNRTSLGIYEKKDNGFYFEIQIVEDNGVNHCNLSEPIKVSKNKLITILGNSYSNIINNVVNEKKIVLSDGLEKKFSNDIEYVTRNNFIDSNSGSKISNGDAKKIIVSQFVDEDHLKISLGNAYINRNSGFVSYLDTYKNDVNYIVGGQLYYMPFKFSEFSGASLKFNLEGSSYFSSITYELCSVKAGSDINYRYRVIDLSDPFPNEIPEKNGKASNWYELWKSNNDILLNRYNDLGVLYNLDLTQNNIQSIRNYNKNKLYINANIDGNGDSSFINNYLKNNIGLDVRHSKPGEEGVVE